jgi:hypothetical protein
MVRSTHLFSIPLSRKKFLRELLTLTVRAVMQVEAAEQGSHTSQGKRGGSFEVAATELCPSLLHLEAERLGINPEGQGAEELRRIVYLALAASCRGSAEKTSQGDENL